jgi:hypothetical protein
MYQLKKQLRKGSVAGESGSRKKEIGRSRKRERLECSGARLQHCVLDAVATLRIFSMNPLD